MSEEKPVKQPLKQPYDPYRRKELAFVNNLLKELEKERKRQIKEALPRGRKEKLAVAREQYIPKSKICPGCFKLKLRPRQWVLVSRKQPVCRGCHKRRLAARLLRDPEAKPRLTRKKLTQEQRAAIIPQDKICPKCKRVLKSSKAWVIVDVNYPMCRGCWKKRPRHIKGYEKGYS